MSIAGNRNRTQPGVAVLQKCHDELQTRPRFRRPVDGSHPCRKLGNRRILASPNFCLPGRRTTSARSLAPARHLRRHGSRFPRRFHRRPPHAPLQMRWRARMDRRDSRASTRRSSIRITSPTGGMVRGAESSSNLHRCAALQHRRAPVLRKTRRRKAERTLAGLERY